MICSVINRLKRQNSLTIIFMNNFLVHQIITLILIFQTIKYLIIDFNRNRVHKHFSNINSNKASGPDGIHGKILKNRSESLAYPLSCTPFKSLVQHCKLTKGMEAGKCRSNSQKRVQGLH